MCLRLFKISAPKTNFREWNPALLPYSKTVYYEIYFGRLLVQDFSQPRLLYCLNENLHETSNELKMLF